MPLIQPGVRKLCIIKLTADANKYHYDQLGAAA